MAKMGPWSRFTPKFHASRTYSFYKISGITKFNINAFCEWLRSCWSARLAKKEIDKNLDVHLRRWRQDFDFVFHAAAAAQDVKDDDLSFSDDSRITHTSGDKSRIKCILVFTNQVSLQVKPVYASRTNFSPHHASRINPLPPSSRYRTKG